MTKKLNYKKIILFWVAVFLLGGAAGVVFGQILIPWLANYSPFNKISWIANSQNGTTIINKTERIVISQDTAYQEAIGRLANSVVAVRSEKHIKIVNKKEVLLAKPEILTEGAGFILTSDGLIVTANILLSETATQVIVNKENGQDIEAQIIKKDAESGLALLKIKQTNLPVVTLIDESALKLGEMVFLLGKSNLAGNLSEFTNLGFIKTLRPEISFNFSEKPLANGSPMADLKGEVFGLNLIDKNGQIRIAGESEIRALLKQ